MLFAYLLIPSEITLAHRFPVAFGWTKSGDWATNTPIRMYPFTRADADHVFKSIPVMTIGAVSMVVVMCIFYLGILKFSKTLLQYARKFAETDEWTNVASVLASFNNSGQHFLDRTGEAHYLLSIALKKVGKPEMSRKAKDFVLNRRASSEWAEKLRDVSYSITAHGPNPAKKKSRSRR